MFFLILGISSSDRKFGLLWQIFMVDTEYYRNKDSFIKHRQEITFSRISSL